MRIDPPPSVAVAMGMMPPDTAAAEPPKANAASDSPTIRQLSDDRTPGKTRAALGRLAGRVRAAAWKLFKKWAADPLFEHDPNKPKEIRPRPKPVSEPRPVVVSKPPPLTASRAEPSTAAPIPKVTTTRPAEIEAEAPPPKWLLNGPRLVAEDGGHLPIVSDVLTIGTDPECDVVAELRPSDTGVVAAHIWAEDDRVVLHVLEKRPKILVNGVEAVWAFLEDGDELEIDGTGYRFEA